MKKTLIYVARMLRRRGAVALAESVVLVARQPFKVDRTRTREAEEDLESLRMDLETLEDAEEIKNVIQEIDLLKDKLHEPIAPPNVITPSAYRPKKALNRK